jgi:hypothetical protein
MPVDDHLPPLAISPKLREARLWCLPYGRASCLGTALLFGSCEIQIGRANPSHTLRPIDKSTSSEAPAARPGASAYLHDPSQLARFGNCSLKCFYHQRLVVSFGALA